MAFFEKFGEKISSAGKDMAKKTKELADVTKLNMQIGSEEDNIKNNYIEIGKLYYGLFSSSPDERLASLCSSITESLNKINTYKEQIQTIKGIKKCPNCGSEIADSAVFCSVCGNKTSSEEEIAPEEANAETKEEAPVVEETPSLCPACNEPIDKNAAFCSKCGQKL
ncbi:MAG: Double zinc ribbon [Firmicutes bacterium ADurb.Bin419]|nr:MAG: Double zinc ribbon [Firmicutes bacterium ADurb.Bin419]